MQLARPTGRGRRGGVDLFRFSDGESGDKDLAAYRPICTARARGRRLGRPHIHDNLLQRVRVCSIVIAHRTWVRLALTLAELHCIAAGQDKMMVMEHPDQSP